MMEQFRDEPNFLCSTDNTEEWNEQRGLDMQHIRALMKLVETFPERFSTQFIIESIDSLPTFQGFDQRRRKPDLLDVICQE